MLGKDKKDLAVYYFVDDLPGAHIPATRLNGLLERLQQGLPLSKIALAYLDGQGLLALHRYATGGSSISDFHQEAKAEQIKRKHKAELLKAEKEAEEQEREAARQLQIKLAQEKATAARQALEKDPKYQAKVMNQKLRARYNLDFFIERHCFFTLMDILRRVDAGNRLSEKDVIWLSTVGDEYFSDNLRAAYHLMEAEFYESQFIKNKDIWMAVNASSHYRKCNKANVACALLKDIDIERKKSGKLKSAFYTTMGGVKRDLGCKDEAIALGEKAHALIHNDFRPCTLLGAVYMETGQYALGHQWYEKAAERGASERAIDNELRSIFLRADKDSQVAMRAHLLSIDPMRYRWVKASVGKR